MLMGFSLVGSWVGGMPGARADQANKHEFAGYGWDYRCGIDAGVSAQAERALGISGTFDGYAWAQSLGPTASASKCVRMVRLLGRV
ncbi:MAG: hypothetical protein LBJ08_05790 [Bifidobacteriaceae bacterium]|nr:hypothetical protein [Bifidobacteriaceae bacterium]